MQTLYFTPNKLLKHASQELSYFRVAEEDKYHLLFFKNDWYRCKMTVLGCGYLLQHVLEFHSFGLMLILESSHPEVKVALKILENSQENTCAGAFFLRKLQNARKYFPGQFFCRTSANSHLSAFLISWLLRKDNILKTTTTVNQNETCVHP